MKRRARLFWAMGVCLGLGVSLACAVAAAIHSQHLRPTQYSAYDPSNRTGVASDEMMQLEQRGQEVQPTAARASRRSGSIPRRDRDPHSGLLEQDGTTDNNGTDLLSREQALSDLRTLREAQGRVVARSPTPNITPTVTITPSAPRPSQQVPEVPALQIGPAPIGMPMEIVVGRTFTSACITPSHDIPTQRMPFVDYLRNVLPNEWVASWPDASLDAGAIAVKQFAWYTVSIQRKWRSKGYPFDVVDNTCDQYYQDGSANPRTDAALQRTWGTLLLRDRALLPLSYRDTDATCTGIPDCMGQVESAMLAGAGHSSNAILGQYFGGRGTIIVMTDASLPLELPPVLPLPLSPISPSDVTPSASTVPSAMVISPTLEAETSPAVHMPDAGTPTGNEEPPPASSDEVLPPIAPSPPSTDAPTIIPSVAIEPTAEAVPAELATPTALLPTFTPTQPRPPVEMPHLVGLGETQARDTLARLGILTVVVDYQGREHLGQLFDEVPAYAVVSHYPSAGVPIEDEQIIVLGVRSP